MKKKKISLTIQYFLNVIPFLYLAIMTALSKYNFINNDLSQLLQVLCYTALFIVIILGFRPKEITDEYAKIILAKIDSMCITFIMIIIMLLTAFIGSPMFKKYSIQRDDIAMILSLILVSITGFKAILFFVYNRRGI